MKHETVVSEEECREKEMEKRVANGEDLDEDAREYLFFSFFKIGVLLYWLADTEDLKVDTLDLHQVAE